MRISDWSSDVCSSDLPTYAEAGFNLGVGLRGQDDLAGAAAAIDAALEHDPDNDRMLVWAGILAHERGQPQEAAEILMRAVDLNPSNPDAFQQLGDVFAALGALDESESCYRMAIQINPGVAGFHGQLGPVLTQLGRLDDARAAFAAARSEQRRVGKGCGSTCRSRGCPHH